MKKCDYFKKSINKCKCKLSNSTITLSDCIKCTKFKQTSISSINITNRSKSVLKRVKAPLNKISKKREFVTKDTYNTTMLKCNNQCVLCGTTQQLQLHHIFGRGKDKTNNIDNCIMLCMNCHLNIVHKNNKYYREYLNNLKF